MKTQHLTGPATACLVLLTVLVRPASAQDGQPIVRADAAGMAGWMGMRVPPDPALRGQGWHSGGLAGGSAGWYWTDHLKTELDAWTGSEQTAYRYSERFVNGRPLFTNVRSRFRRRALGAAQHYQFFRNAWFHPFLGAGLSVTWERRVDFHDEVVSFDSSGRAVVIEQPRTEGPGTDIVVRPFLAGGFKAYITKRAFFRSDVRVTFRGGADEVSARAGLGIDF